MRVLRPVAFRLPISRGLAFLYALNILIHLLLYAKIMQN